MLKFFIKYSKGYRHLAILTPIFVALEAFIEVLLPLFMTDIIDLTDPTIGYADSLVSGPMSSLVSYFENLFPNSNNVYIYVYGVVMLIFALLSLTFGVVSGITATAASSGFAKNVRESLYHHIQDYSFENIDKYSTSSLITRLTSDITNCQQSFQMTTRITFRAPLLFLFSIIMSFITNAKLAIIFVIASPVLVILLLIVMLSAHKYFKQMFKKYDSLNLVVQENIIGMRTVKAYTNENEECLKFEKASNALTDNAKHAERIVVFNSPIMQSIIYGCILIVTFIGAKAIVFENGESSLLFLFITYSTQILSSLMMISMIFLMLIMSKASADRIIEALNENPTIKNNENPIFEVKDGSVEFNGVNFSYLNDMSKLALIDINFKFESGKTIGVFGGTGSGKTTLLSLIPRLYDATTGEVIVGGVNVKDYDIKTLRDNVAMVLQKNVLFSGTIKDNLRWGNKDATDEEMINACKLAQAHDFIMSFPDGYDTYIEQGGVNVSGGQKQRLCIARALLKNPKILILDDSTSACDTKTDALIRNAFKECIPNTTKFIITQRIASVEDADYIIFIHDGKIQNIAPHSELIEQNEIYRSIYNAQTKGGK